MIDAAIGVAMVLAAMVSYAQETPAQAVVAVAQEADVDPVDLAGAVNTTGLDPREYLYAVGELEWPYTPAPRVVAAATPFGLSPYLASVAWCESHFRTDVIYGPTRGRLGEIGLFQLKPGGMLPVFYSMGYTNPWNPWQQAEFARWAFTHGYAGRWSCA